MADSVRYNLEMFRQRVAPKPGTFPRKDTLLAFEIVCLGVPPEVVFCLWPIASGRSGRKSPMATFDRLSLVDDRRFHIAGDGSTFNGILLTNSRLDHVPPQSDSIKSYGKHLATSTAGVLDAHGENHWLDLLMSTNTLVGGRYSIQHVAVYSLKHKPYDGALDYYLITSASHVFSADVAGAAPPVDPAAGGADGGNADDDNGDDDDVSFLKSFMAAGDTGSSSSSPSSGVHPPAGDSASGACPPAPVSAGAVDSGDGESDDDEAHGDAELELLFGGDDAPLSLLKATVAAPTVPPPPGGEVQADDQDEDSDEEDSIAVTYTAASAPTPPSAPPAFPKKPHNLMTICTWGHKYSVDDLERGLEYLPATLDPSTMNVLCCGSFIGSVRNRVGSMIMAQCCCAHCEEMTAAQRCTCKLYWDPMGPVIGPYSAGAVHAALFRWLLAGTLVSPIDHVILAIEQQHLYSKAQCLQWYKAQAAASKAAQPGSSSASSS